MLTLSSTKLKYFVSLHEKKFRNQEGLFFVEGIKMLKEAINSGWEIIAVVAIPSLLQKLELELSHFENITYICKESEYYRLSNLNNPEGVLCIIKQPDKNNFINLDYFPAFALYQIQDPGNLGTILRIADWFGFHSVICSEGTADCYNPKVLRASMGSIFRIKIVYITQFFDFIQKYEESIILADMDGDSIYTANLKGKNIFLLGNEGQGLPQNIQENKNLQKVSIPKVGGAESLNVSVAAGILASHAINKMH